MKTVLCFGDSNTWGCAPIRDGSPSTRYAVHERWPGVLRSELGDGFWVVEEGLNGRTTVWDDPINPSRSGRDLLLPCLLTHRPVDLVVVMLGTNDLKARFAAAARDVAEGAGRLVHLAQRSECGPDNGEPQVLLVCPPPIGRLTAFADEFAGATAKSQELATHYAAAAEEQGCAFLDAGQAIRSSDGDGIHLDVEEHAKLGRFVAPRVRELLS